MSRSLVRLETSRNTRFGDLGFWVWAAFWILRYAAFMSFVNLEFWSDRWRDKFNNDLYIRRLSCLISFIMHFVFCLKKIKYCRESKASLLKVFKEIRIEPIRIERVEAVVRTVRLVRVSRWSDLVTKIVWKMLMPYQVFLCSSASPFLINHYFVYQRSSLSVPPRCSSINSSALKKNALPDSPTIEQ